MPEAVECKPLGKTAGAVMMAEQSLCPCLQCALAKAAGGRHHGEVIQPGQARLVPSCDVSQAAWIQARLAGPGQGIRPILPTGFAA